MSSKVNCKKSLQIRIFITVVISFNFCLEEIHCHGTMIDPVSRNSLWRVEPDAPINYNDIELFCGGFGVSRYEFLIIKEAMKLSYIQLTSVKIDNNWYNCRYSLALVESAEFAAIP